MNRSGRPVTMREVADRAGVSVMTVSLALRGGPKADRMTAETRDRVIAAATELGYRVNVQARALRIGRTNVIGLYAGHGFVNVRIPFFTDIVSGIQEACEEVRRDLLLHGTYHGDSEEEVFQSLVDGRMDGLIVQIGDNHRLAQLLTQSDFASVALADPIAGIPSVVVDEDDGARQIIEHLKDKGHRYVAYVPCATVGISSAERRLEAFLRHADSVGLRSMVLRPREGENLADVARLAVQLGITAIACWNDQTANALWVASASVGLRVPEQLAIVGFDGTPLSYDAAPPLTTVFAPWTEAARTAVLQLEARLRGDEIPAETVLPVRLLPGCTT